MINKNKVLILLGACLWSICSLADSYLMSDLENLKNDKEVHISVFSDKRKEEVLQLYPDIFLQNQLGTILYQSTLQFLNTSNWRCELNVIDILKVSLSEQSLSNSKEDIDNYITLARATHYIDDIYYDFLIGINEDYHHLPKLDVDNVRKTNKIVKRWRRSRSNKTQDSNSDLSKLLNENNIEKLYSNFVSWPDEKEFCAYQEFNFIKTDLKDPNSKNGKIKNKRKLSIIEDLNKEALSSGTISAKTYWKLEYLRRESFTSKRYLRLQDYFSIIFKAKNKLKPTSYVYEIKDIETEYNFSSERLKRFKKITRRKKLFHKYNETQVVLLAQVLVKASRRMGVDPDVTASRPVITQSFEFINENGEKENYVEELVLDPRSQFNLARKRMRKDILDLEAMDLFYGTNIYYDEVVMAAFETGYLSIEDIEYALKYDDLWNPNKTRFEKITGFIFKITGYATFFIPPPLNIPATLVLAITQGFVNNSNRKGEDNDNAATFID